MNKPTDHDEYPLPPDRRYKFRLDNDITGEDWEFLNAEQERVGGYEAILDEKVDLEFRLHDLKEQLGMVPPTPPQSAATPPPTTQSTPPTDAAKPAPKAEAAPRILLTAPPRSQPPDSDVMAEVEAHPS